MDDLKNQLEQEAARKVARIQGCRKWLKTKPIANLLDTVWYLKEKYSLDMWHAVDESGARIYLTATNLTGLKDESLAALLNSFLYANPDRQDTSDYPASYSRVYRHYWDSPADQNMGGYTLGVSVTAQFKEDSDTCKRVVVGYNEPSKEPTPIYKLECVDPEAQE